MRLLILLFAALVIVGCSKPPDAGSKQPPPGAEGMSLLGKPFAPPPLAPDKRAEREKLVEEARAMPADAPDRDVLIGRRLGHLQKYAEAIAAFTEGIARHPDDARLYRHRGHRYITTRQFDKAVADLERAAVLIKDQPDEIEPDVQPNPKGGPVNSLRSNVWYHLGLVHYLRRDFEKALKAYREGMKVADNPDRICSNSYWLYLTLRRLGKHDEAKVVLGPIRAEWEPVESGSYHKLLLVFRGDRKADEVLEAARKDPEPVPFPTVAYGLCAWFSLNGDEANAEALRKEIVSGPMWPAFGFIAAESELAQGSSAATTRKPESRPK